MHQGPFPITDQTIRPPSGLPAALATDYLTETAMALASPNPNHPPPGKGVSYGCVIVDAARERVLLRRPSGGYLGYAWTFPKGMPDTDERPEVTAIREAREECGVEARLLAPLPQWFSGPTWANWFWLAEATGDSPARFHWETEAVRWCTWTEAEAAIRETTSAHRRDRDLAILAAARQAAC